MRARLRVVWAEAVMSLLDLLRMQKADAEARLDEAQLSSEAREVDQAYLAEIERLIAAN
jgi:hypothetical protein